MASLSDGDKILNICLFVSTEYTNVTDRRTDRQTDGHRMTAQPHLHSIARQSLMSKDPESANETSIRSPVNSGSYSTLFNIIPEIFLLRIVNTCLCCKYEWRVAVVVCQVWIDVLDCVQEL